MVGDSRVGKNSIRKRYMGEGFKGTYAATLGAEFSVKSLLNTTVTIFDLGGEPATKLFRIQYYPGSQGIIMVFDINNRESFQNLPGWFQEFRSSIHPKLPVFVLGNKEDLRKEAADPVNEWESYEYTRALAEESGTSISYLSTSAFTGYNVEVVFTKLIAEISLQNEDES